jgi:hypothetical protein
MARWYLAHRGSKAEEFLPRRIPRVMIASAHRRRRGSFSPSRHREVAVGSKADRLPTKTLLAALHALDGGDWSEFCGVRGEQQPHKLRDSELATMLRDFRIKPRGIWPLNRTATSKAAKGYLRRHFEDAWSRYCSDDVTASHASNIKALSLVDDDTA